MWKGKMPFDVARAAGALGVAGGATPEAEKPKKIEKKSRSISMGSVAIIGKSIVIKGELSGNEDLTIEGKVDGKINLADNNLIIGAEGRVKADLYARQVTITGRVEGDVIAGERVEITATGSLKGNIRAPRLVILDGAAFEGAVEMKTLASSDTQKVKAPLKAMEAGSSKPTAVAS